MNVNQLANHFVTLPSAGQVEVHGLVLCAVSNHHVIVALGGTLDQDLDRRAEVRLV
jgi:hypothetical protein